MSLFFDGKGEDQETWDNLLIREGPVCGRRVVPFALKEGFVVFFHRRRAPGMSPVPRWRPGSLGRAGFLWVLALKKGQFATGRKQQKEGFVCDKQ